MPTYDYHCDTCGKDFEWFQSMKEDKLTRCPEEACASVQTAQKGNGAVHRKISGGTGLIFNGDGFYLTDYVKTSGGAGKAATDATSKAPTESAGGTSTPATSSESSAGGSGSTSNSTDSMTPSKAATKAASTPASSASSSTT